MLPQGLDARLEFEGRSYRIVDLPALFGDRLSSLPFVLRLLLENSLRNLQGDEQAAAVRGLFDWLDTGRSEVEIAFQPGRVLMHDTTSTPALVDVAGMRDSLAEAGIDSATLNPVLPVDISIDHSLAVEFYGEAGAAERNLQLEIRRNAERYRFLRWSSKVLDGVRIHPPGTGIMHTINLEQLATLVTTEERDGETWLVPDMMIGTDSHTPMINGLGVLGWGVGGLEAQTVMFGMPVMLRIPEVVGVRLTGHLSGEVLATDLALLVTRRLRELDVAGAFVEFFGPGVSTLSVGDRAVVANMTPEFGGATGYFAADAQSLDYLRRTGRSEAAVLRAERYLKRTGLWFDPALEPRYTRILDIDLGRIGKSVAGPRRPQDQRGIGELRAVLGALDFKPQAGANGLPRHPVAVAAITSCTNTSHERLLIAAGLMARKARRLGLRPPAWVKTSLAPGSPAAASYLKRAGLVEDLAAVGYDIVGFGCTTCIGNSGPLTHEVVTAQQAGACKAVAVLSGNRNFPGRVHPDLELGFIMSPALVIAYGLAGNAEIDLDREPVQTGSDGHPVYLRDLWPSRDEIDACQRLAMRSDDFARDFAQASRNPLWHALDAPDTPRFPWDPQSTALRRPPFCDLGEGSLLGHYDAFPLLVVGDDVTTDHISPASAIPKDSLVADFLVGRGDDRDDLNVFASRRGNWEVMLRAAFHSKTLVNLLRPGMPVAHTLHVPDGEVLPIWEAADRYRKSGQSVVLIAGERYGMGSSRDWAAKGQRLLGIRCVLAVSFERIHRSNLIGMGILPLQLPAGVTPQTLAIQPGDRIEVDASPEKINTRGPVAVGIRRADGCTESFNAIAAVETALEVDLLRLGGVIPAILQQKIAANRGMRMP